MRENAIEKYLHDRVKELGGEHRRIAWIGRNNAPDDLLLLPGEHMLVECKRPGEKPRPGQEREHERLRAAGIQVHVVSTFEQIDALLPIGKTHECNKGGVAMSSKYRAKTRPTPTKQMPVLKELSLRVAQPRGSCPVCGTVQTRHGKCECGATFQGKSTRF